MDHLTEKNKVVLQAIINYVTAYRAFPTVRTLCKLTNLTSTGTIHEHLSRLEHYGVLQRNPYGQLYLPQEITDNIEGE